MKKRTPKNTRTPPDAFVIETEEHYSGIESPIRDRILQIVLNQTADAHPSDEPAGVTISEIAQQLGRKPGTIYRHIDTLVELGLLQELGTRTTGGRDAMRYGTQGSVLVLKIPDDKDALDLMCRHVERSNTLAGKELAAAIRQHAEAPRSRKPKDPLAPKDHMSLGMIGWLDENQMDDIREHMHAIAAIYRDAKRRKGTTLSATNLTVRPVRLPDGSKAVEE